ncbi:MAG: hypothetical protein LBU37_10315 [Tannerellaceae bacterium]|jgi:hypothetical protein|nr:hypothetical protein [Tannerellaceae bacterium]
MSYYIDETNGDVEYEVNGNELFLKVASGEIPGGSGGSGGIVIIKLGETTTPGDANVYSALRQRNEFLKRKEEDTAQKKITFLEGWQAGQAFSPGFAGEGAALFKEGNKWRFDVDTLNVRGAASFAELVIEEVKSIAGTLIVSVAQTECTGVEERDTSYRCYFDNQNGYAPNKFSTGDQAICQKFDGDNVKRYWRLVAGTGTNYIDLSKSDCEAGSGIPGAGDKIVQLGSRTNAERQSAIIITAKGAEPSIAFYEGINNYSLADKAGTVIGRNGRFKGIVEALGGVFSGYLKMPFVELNESDAVTADNITFLLKNNLNVFVNALGADPPYGDMDITVILPYDPSYTGSVVNIVDGRFGPYTKTYIGYTKVSAQLHPSVASDSLNALLRHGIAGTYKSGAKQDATYPLDIALLGEHMQFVGVPGHVGNNVKITRWVAVNYKP